MFDNLFGNGCENVNRACLLCNISTPHSHQQSSGYPAESIQKKSNQKTNVEKEIYLVYELHAFLVDGVEDFTQHVIGSSFTPRGAEHIVQKSFKRYFDLNMLGVERAESDILWLRYKIVKTKYEE